MSISLSQLFILFIVFLFIFGYFPQVFDIFLKGFKRFQSLFENKKK